MNLKRTAAVESDFAYCNDPLDVSHYHNSQGDATSNMLFCDWLFWEWFVTEGTKLQYNDIMWRRGTHDYIAFRTEKYIRVMTIVYWPPISWQHWSLFPRVQLAISRYWFRYWLGADRATSHVLNQWWLVHWRIYASLGLNDLQLCRTFEYGWYST